MERIDAGNIARLYESHAQKVRESVNANANRLLISRDDAEKDCLLLANNVYREMIRVLESRAYEIRSTINPDPCSNR